MEIFNKTSTVALICIAGFAIIGYLLFKKEKDEDKKGE
jgi:hypothetical protein